MIFKVNRDGARIAVSYTDDGGAARIALHMDASTHSYGVPVDNFDEIARAKRAIELGLDVDVPKPVFPALVDRREYDRLVEEMFDQAVIIEHEKFEIPRLDFSNVEVPHQLRRGCAYSDNAVSAPTGVDTTTGTVYVSYTYIGAAFGMDMAYDDETAKEFGVDSAELSAILVLQEAEHQKRLASIRSEERASLARHFGIA